MLTKCPECDLPVSDKAFSCPHCGYPLQQNIKPRLKTPTHMRLPNGFGQITKISGKNLRNPYRVMVSVGKDENGRPIAKMLKPKAYFATYNEAYAALVEFNKNPYDLTNQITFKELYDKWSTEHFEKISLSTQKEIACGWVYCKPLYDMPVRDIKSSNIRLLFDNTEAPLTMKKMTKSVIDRVLDYAISYEIIDKNVSRNLKLGFDYKAKTEHITFTDDEIKVLWQNINDPIVRMILIQCYSGFRPQELLKLKKENINLDNWTAIGGLKTDNGKDRIVPIHSGIRDLVKGFYDESDEFLFDSALELNYNAYNRRFHKAIAEYKLNSNHRPHDPRVYFVSIAKESGMDEYALKRIVGHSITDLTEKVYAKRPVEWLCQEMEKIKAPCFN